MTVKVELEFKSVDEAIVALGKLIGAAATVRGEPVVVPETPREAKRAANRAKMEAIQAEVKARRPRADKGVPRGPYKNAEASAAGESTRPEKSSDGSNAVTAPGNGGQQAPTPTATVAPASVVPVVQGGEATIASAPVPTPEAVQAAVERLFNTKGYDVCRDVLLSRYGVARGKDLAPEVRADFVKHAEGVIAGTEGV